MANKTITDLTAASTLDGSELVHVVQGGNSRKTALSAYPISSATAAALAALVMPGALYGLTLSNNATDATNDVDVAAGVCASSLSTPILMTYAGAAGRQLDVAYGTGNGARFDSSISDGTWHAFIISNGTTVAFGFSKSLNPTAQANYPSGYTHYRRIGSIVRDSAALRVFTQIGDKFIYFSPREDVAVTNLAAAPGTTFTLPSIPTGIKVDALITAAMSNASANRNGLVNAVEQSDDAPGNSGQIWMQVSGQLSSVSLQIRTNTSAQIRGRSDQASTTFRVSVVGYIDHRGRQS